MLDDKLFLKLVLDTMPEQVVVINKEGDIVFINKGWQNFGEENDCSCGAWEKENYLFTCKKAADNGDEIGVRALEGINAVINEQQDDLYLEYPCHSDDEKRWFMMRVVPFKLNTDFYYVITHQNITERKLAEEEVQQLANIDGLTDIFNRGYFDSFLEQEWNRCKRLNMPLSLAIIDLDDFKLLNDTYGHQQGDECLKQVAAILEQYTKRPSDICARFGGEEFALVYGNTSSEQATTVINAIVEQLKQLNICNELSLPSKTLTVSIGLASVVPCSDYTIESMIKEADDLLYKAKATGKNLLCVADLTVVD